MKLTRRAFATSGLICGADLCCGGLVTPVYAQRAIPFCGFSLEDGWTAYGREFVTREARGNDRSGVPQIVRRILEELGLDYDFRILITEDEDNAYATVAGGRKILGIDVDFLDRLNDQVGTEWSAIQVIAHEVGHHIAGFDTDSHRGELNADYWSGQALQRLGSSSDAAQAAILAIGSERDTSSHPNKYRRAAVIARGWDDASNDIIDRSFCQDC
ncbi:hypothetical protein [Blastomonas sp. SL216]|uniref:hypothetical protein n=1 Tax=Blastomonas sp. SL216 TaxID=2995169 RepID=UPI002376ED85|nr:hypothetical protein OU999_06960 [Blastomonas sp. SL216]